MESQSKSCACTQNLPPGSSSADSSWAAVGKMSGRGREHGAERDISPEDTDVALMGLPGGLANLAVPSRSTLAVHLELAVESSQINRLAVFQFE